MGRKHRESCKPLDFLFLSPLPPIISIYLYSGMGLVLFKYQKILGSIWISRGVCFPEMFGVYLHFRSP